jgi:hypothetical protein
MNACSLLKNHLKLKFIGSFKEGNDMFLSSNTIFKTNYIEVPKSKLIVHSINIDLMMMIVIILI